HKELQRNWRGMVILVLVERSVLRPLGVNERTQMEFSVRLQPANCHRRGEGMLAILLNGIIGSHKPRGQNGCVQGDQKKQPDLGFVEWPLHDHSARIRGSAQNSRMSARRFPAMRNIVESKTPPITTYKSRASMASSKKGPNPGHPVTTSTSSDPLKRVPI